MPKEAEPDDGEDEAQVDLKTLTLEVACKMPQRLPAQGGMPIPVAVFEVLEDPDDEQAPDSAPAAVTQVPSSSSGSLPSDPAAVQGFNFVDLIKLVYSFVTDALHISNVQRIPVKVRLQVSWTNLSINPLVLRKTDLNGFCVPAELRTLEPLKENWKLNTTKTNRLVDLESADVDLVELFSS